jgi:trehalose-6-phosphate synthase
MTDLARALPKNVLMAVDRYRALYGIRSRAKALERMVQTVAPEHPLEVTLRNAEKLPKGSVSKEVIAQFEESRRLQEAGLEEFVSLEEAMSRRKKNVRSS